MRNEMKIKVSELRTMLREAVLQAIEEVKFDPKSLSNTINFPSFGERISWANTHLRKLGEGSSRAAYILDSKKVLKLALNPKGIAQNETEIEIATNPSLSAIYARIFQYDPKYKWITSELVREISNEEEFEHLTGVHWKTFRLFMIYAYKSKASRNVHDYIDSVYDELIDFYDFDDNEANELVDRTIKSKWFLEATKTIKQTSLLGGDLKVLEHWGKTPDQRVVLLDYGFTKEVWGQFYKN